MDRWPNFNLTSAGGDVPTGVAERDRFLNIIGIVFEISSASQTNSVGLLQAISQIGGTVFPSSPSDPTNGFKWCIGTLSQRQAKLQQAFSTIMDSTVPIVLVK